VEIDVSFRFRIRPFVDAELRFAQQMRRGWSHREIRAGVT
jgi:hypothetical protein